MRNTHAAATVRPDVLLFQRIEDLAGAELTMFRIVQDLQARGIRVKSALYGSRAKESARDFPWLKASALPIVRTRDVVLPLARLLRRERPCVLLSALTITNCAAVAGARLAAVPTAVVQTEHNPVVARCRHTGLRRTAYLQLLRTSYRLAQAVVAVSAGVGREIGTLTGGAVQARIIYNPAVDNDPPPASDPPHPWLVPGEQPCILAVGRLRPEKNYPLLLHAFAEARRHRRCRLIIIGDGPERPQLEAICRDRDLTDSVLLPGYINAPSGWLNHASLFVCSSLYEGFGNVIVEAMACGVPVVSTDCPFGPAEILDGGRYGILVPNDRADLLADALLRGLDQPADPDRLRARAAMFSRARAADAYATLLKEYI